MSKSRPEQSPAPALLTQLHLQPGVCSFMFDAFQRQSAASYTFR